MHTPVRKIGIGYSGSLRAALPSTKVNRVVRVESALESSFCLLLEFDPRVRSYCEQPVTIPYTLPNGARSDRRYTPDFLIHYHDDTPPVLAEVKYRSELLTKAAELTPKFDAAHRYAVKQGWEFRVFTEVDIATTPLLTNARFLLRFRTPPTPATHADVMLARLAKLGESTPTELSTAAAYYTGFLPEELLPHCWHLLGCGRIGCDLDQAPLTMTSRIWSL